jgi:hypothetical protein
MDAHRSSDRDDFVAPDNLGRALALEGGLDRAMPHFRQAAKINPLDPVSNLNIAAHEQEHGKSRSMAICTKA